MHRHDKKTIYFAAAYVLYLAASLFAMMALVPLNHPMGLCRLMHAVVVDGIGVACATYVVSELDRHYMLRLTCGVCGLVVLYSLISEVLRYAMEA